MFNLDRKPWWSSKQAERIRRYRRRMAQLREAEPTAWLAAVDRDDRTDPAEHHRGDEHQ
jgi:hypothetical protein